MQTTLNAQTRILGLWRTVLVMATLPLGLACSLILRPGGWPWWVATGVWAGFFFFCYLFYLPAKQRRFSLGVRADRLALRAGVFFRIERTVPFESVQFIRIRSSFLHKRLGLATLIVVCAGGRMVMPGLEAKNADRLVRVIFAEE